MSKLYAFVVITFGVLASTLPAQAQGAFEGKKITLYIGTASGGSYDLYGRLVARYLGKYIPGNPTVVPTNMPGAGTLRLANYLFNAAPKDGTAIGIITQTVALEEALGTPEVRFKAASFNYIGRVTSNTEISITRRQAKTKTIDDARKMETIVAGTGAGLPSVVYPTVLNNVAGTKFKVVAGYTGSTESLLAMDRGEVDGALTSWNSLKTTQKSTLGEQPNILVQYALTRETDLQNVPTMVDLGRTDEERQVLSLYASTGEVGRSILAPPDIPDEQVAQLRAAFIAMLKDAALLEEIQKMQAEFKPLPGSELQKIIEAATSVPESVRHFARKARGL